MRIVVVFSDHERFIPRPNVGDICLITRYESRNIEIKFQGKCTGHDINNIPILGVIEKLDDIIARAPKINVEIIGHSSKGGKSLQSDVTKAYPLLNVPLDALALWIQKDLLKNRHSDSTIALLSCEAADGKDNYPAVAEQLFELFELKPLKLTARMGYGYIEKHVYSLRTLDMAAKTAVDQKKYNKECSSKLESAAFSILRTYNSFFPYSTITPLGEKFVYFLGKDKKTYKLDKQVYDTFRLMKEMSLDHPKIKEVLEKNLENVSIDEFILLAKKGIQISSNAKLISKASLVLKGKFKAAQQIVTDVSDYTEKNMLLQTIDSLKINANRNKIQNSESIIKFFNSIQDFIIYRHPRNYSIFNLARLVNIMLTVVGNDGVLTNQHLKELTEFKNQIASADQIKKDSLYRSNAVGLRLPSYHASINKATVTKNKAFSQTIEEFLKSVKTNENTLDDNKTFSKVWDKDIEDFEVKPEKELEALQDSSDFHEAECESEYIDLSNHFQEYVMI